MLHNVFTSSFCLNAICNCSWHAYFVFEIQNYPEDLGFFSSYQIAVIMWGKKKPWKCAQKVSISHTTKLYQNDPPYSSTSSLDVTASAISFEYPMHIPLYKNLWVTHVSQGANLSLSTKPSQTSNKKYQVLRGRKDNPEKRIIGKHSKSKQIATSFFYMQCCAGQGTCKKTHCNLWAILKMVPGALELSLLHILGVQ
jgi:hypothetical protein